MEEYEIGNTGRKIKVGSQLSPPIKESLVAFLRDNTDVFAWSYEDMPGIDPSVLTQVECRPKPSTGQIEAKKFHSQEKLGHS